MEAGSALLSPPEHLLTSEFEPGFRSCVCGVAGLSLSNSGMGAISASPQEAVPLPDMEEVSESASPLLSLPEHLLALVVSEVQGGKNGLRTTCRSLRLAVNHCTLALTWTRPRGLDGGPVLHAHLPASLTGACPGIKLVARKIPSWSPALRPVPRPFTPCSAASPRFSC